MSKFKIKTSSSVKKRFKKLSNLLFKYKKSNMRHILIKKSKNRKRRLRKKSFMNKSNIYLLNRCLPYK